MTFWWWSKCLLKPICTQSAQKSSSWDSGNDGPNTSNFCHSVHTEPMLGVSLERDRGYPQAARAHVWKGGLNEAQAKGSVVRAMEVHYILSLLLSWARMSWQKQLKIRFNLAHGSSMKSAVVDSSSSRQLVTLYPHLGSRGRWCSFWAHFLIIQSVTSAHVTMLSIAKIFFPG